MPHKDTTKARDYQRRYRLSHLESVREYARNATAKWRSRNPEKAKAACREYYRKLKLNPKAYSRYLKMMRDQRRQRYQVDEVFRIYCNARTKITVALRKGKNQKRGRTEELLGCTILELKSHLESQFVDGMSWDNKFDWHIDHIRSCASFDLSDPNQVKQCFHYTNLRPIWSKENREKWAHFHGYHHNSVRHRHRNSHGQFLPN